MYVDGSGMQAYPVPVAMSEAEVEAAVAEYVESARLAVGSAGFDGVELHRANGYLIDQFLSPVTNQRTDQWGKERNRFAVQVAKRTAVAIGAERLGIRLSPYGVFNGMAAFAGMNEQYVALAAALSR